METIERYRNFFAGLKLEDGVHIVQKPFEQAVDDGEFARILESASANSPA